jgi:prophage regulatory protein
LNKDYEKQANIDRLIRIDEVLARLPISKSTWWQGVKTGRFPQPVKLGERITCWRMSDIDKLTAPDPAKEPHANTSRTV